jgi:hypothetical protein
MKEVTDLFKAVFECQALKDFITITEDLAKDKDIDAQKVFNRREKFTNKILLQTGTIIDDADKARETVNNILMIIDTTTLKNCRWLDMN